MATNQISLKQIHVFEISSNWWIYHLETYLSFYQGRPIVQVKDEKSAIMQPCNDDVIRVCEVSLDFKSSFKIFAQMVRTQLFAFFASQHFSKPTWSSDDSIINAYQINLKCDSFARTACCPS